MKLSISPELRRAFPEVQIALLTAFGVDNRTANSELGREIDEATAAFRARFADEAALLAHPLLEVWRAAYTRFGANPKRNRPSAEALLRRVVKGNAVPRINTVVDAYLLSELQFLLPVGGYDLGHVRGEIVLRTSPGGEAFVAIGSDKPEPTQSNEVVYADEGGVLTRCWNWRDADRTKITEATTDLVLCLELPLPAPEGATALARQAELIADRLARYCGGRVTNRMLGVDALEAGVTL